MSRRLSKCLSLLLVLAFLVPGAVAAGPSAALPPTASFTSSTPACLGQQILLSDTTSGEVILHEWDYGDGSVGTGANPAHTYTAPGTYTVTLATGNDSGVTEYSDTVEVLASVEAFFWPESDKVSVGQPLQFENAGPETAQGYQWDFGDGNVSSEISPTHVYTASGEYVVQLTALASSPCVPVTHSASVRAGHRSLLPAILGKVDMAQPLRVVENLALSISGPHRADGLDVATIVVTATSADGTPLANRPVGVELHDDNDPRGIYAVSDNGDGTYTAEVTSTVAADLVVLAVDYGSHLVVTDTLYFLPGDPQAIEWVEVIRPHDTDSKDRSLLTAVVVDSLGNQIPPPTVAISFSTDFGFLSESEEEGYFTAQIVADDYGVARVTAADPDGLLTSVFTDVAFLPVYLDTSGEATGGAAILGQGSVGDELVVDVSIWNPYLTRALGYYCTTLNYDPSVLRFRGVMPGVPNGAISHPEHWQVDANTVGFYATNTEQHQTPQLVRVARVVFDVLDVGDPSLNIRIFQDDVSNLRDLLEQPLITLPQYSNLQDYFMGWEWFIYHKLPKWVKIKVWLAPGATPNVAGHVARMNAIYSQHLGKCCPKLIFFAVTNKVTQADWDKINEGSSTLDRAERNALRAKYNMDKAINVIYTPNNSLAGATGMAIEGDGIIVDSDAGDNTLAHEAGHHYGLRDTYDASKKSNLMYGRKNAKKSGLTAAQCATIAASAS